MEEKRAPRKCIHCGKPTVQFFLTKEETSYKPRTIYLLYGIAGLALLSCFIMYVMSGYKGTNSPVVDALNGITTYVICSNLFKVSVYSYIIGLLLDILRPKKTRNVIKAYCPECNNIYTIKTEFTKKELEKIEKSHITNSKQEI